MDNTTEGFEAFYHRCLRGFHKGTPNIPKQIMVSVYTSDRYYNNKWWKIENNCDKLLYSCITFLQLPTQVPRWLQTNFAAWHGFRKDVRRIYLHCRRLVGHRQTARRRSTKLPPLDHSALPVASWLGSSTRGWTALGKDRSQENGWCRYGTHEDEGVAQKRCSR